jgi:hypothetical protein
VRHQTPKIDRDPRILLVPYENLSAHDFAETAVFPSCNGESGLGFGVWILLTSRSQRLSTCTVMLHSSQHALAQPSMH